MVTRLPPSVQPGIHSSNRTGQLSLTSGPVPSPTAVAAGLARPGSSVAMIRTVATPDFRGAGAEGYLRFTQAGWSYLLAARSLVAVVGPEHLRPLRQPVPGWAGTLAIRGGVVPVLDASDLLGHGGGPGGVLLLRLPSGPLGLAVERLEGIDPLPYAGLAPIPGVVGVTGGLAAPHDVSLALSLDHLDALRQIAVSPSPDGSRRPPALTWSLPLSPNPEPSPVPDQQLRIGDPLVVLAERWLIDDRCSLALPLREVRVVARVTSRRPVPAGHPGVVGLGAWGPRAIPLISLSGLQLVFPSPTEPQYAVVLISGVAVLVTGVRGVQGLTSFRPAPTDDQPLLSTLGETMGRRAGERISAGILNEERPSRSVPDPIHVAVISTSRLRASLEE